MLITKFKSLLSGKFIQNVSWLGAAELLNRFFRLGTTVVLARLFTREDYGIVAIIYTVFEFASVLTLRYGIGAKIVQSSDSEVDRVCDTAYWLNWMLCGLLFIIQCVAAFPIARIYQNNQLVPLICTVALVYLILPLYMVPASIIQRENQFKIIALCNAAQSIVANTLTIVLAFLKMGVWSVVVPMVLSAPVWIIITWRNHHWRPPKSFTLEGWREISSFGGNLFGVELLKKVRSNIDYLIVGNTLGINALGIYFFAFNAGIGISLNVINLFSSAVLPYLCEARGDMLDLKKRYFSSTKKISLVIVPLILLQSLLAPFYVPIIFGQKWLEAIPILMIICLSALMFPLGITTNELLNALGKTHITLFWNFIYTIIFSIAILIALPGGVLGVAISVLVCQLTILPLFSVWVINTFLKSNRV